MEAVPQFEAGGGLNGSKSHGFFWESSGNDKQVIKVYKTEVSLALPSGYLT